MADGLTALKRTVLHRFAAGDEIDLLAFRYSNSDTVNFAANSAGTGGVLTIGNGSQTINITLFSQYVAAGFHFAQDGGAGTLISYAPPAPAHLELAAGH